MTLKTTASGNFDNKQNWGGLRKHMEHDPKINHKNKYLNTDESKEKRKYNFHEVLVDYDDWTNKKFGSFVKEHDEKMLDKKRKFGSVKRFLEVDNNGKARKRHPDQEFIEKLSNFDDYQAFQDAFIEKLQDYQWATGKNKGKYVTEDEARDASFKIICNGFKKYAKGFNERNSNIKMFEYYVHMDELGAPHLHSRVMPFYQDEKLTKKGNKKKPSWSLNTALRAQYGNLDENKANLNKENLSRFRKQEDQALIDCMNEEIKDELGIDNAFQLIRKTDIDKALQTGENHEVYKAKHEALDKLNAEIASKQATLDDLKEDVKTYDEKLNGHAIQNRKTHKTIRQGGLKNEVADAKKAKQKALDDRKDIINATTHEALKSAQNAQKSYVERLQEREQQLNERETKLAEREKNLENKEQFIRNVEKSFWAGFYNKDIEEIDVDTAKDVYNDLRRQAPSNEKFIDVASNSFKNGVVYTVADLTHLDFDNLNNAINNKLQKPSQQQQKQKQQNNDLEI